MSGLDTKAFLNAISKIESAGDNEALGQPIKYGMDKGKLAIGKYQFTPSTIDTIADNSNDPGIQSLSGLPDEEKQKVLFSHPELQDKMANEHLNRISRLVGKDPQKLAYAWNQGPGNVDNFDPEHDYVKKFNKAYGKRNPSSDNTESEDFDPDAYLAKKQVNAPEKESDDFDPDAYLAKKQVNSQPEASKQQMGLGDAILTKASQGATANWYDELAGLAEAGGQAVGIKGITKPITSGEVGLQKPVTDWEKLKEIYAQTRDTERAKVKQAEQDHPVASTVSEIGGSLLMPAGAAAKTAKGAMAVGAGIGAASALGRSDKDDLKQTAIDTAIGGGVGAAAGYVGQKVAKALTPEARQTAANVRGVKALGGKATDENMQVAQTMLENGKLPMMGGASAIERAAETGQKEMEQQAVPILQKANQSIQENPEILNKVPDLEMKVAEITDQFNHTYTGSDKSQIIDKVNKEAEYWTSELAKVKDNPFALRRFRGLIDDNIKKLDPQAFNPDASLDPVVKYLVGLRNTVNEHLGDMVNAASDNPNMSSQYRNIMQKYSHFIKADSLANKLGQKDLVNTPGSINLKDMMVLGGAKMLKSPAMAGADMAKVGAEMVTGNPINRLGNIASARFQNMTAKGLATPIGGAIGKVAARSTEKAIMNTGVQTGLSLFKVGDDKLKLVADALSKSPSGRDLGDALNDAIVSNNEAKKNKITFAIDQRPDLRDTVQQVVGTNKEEMPDFETGDFGDGNG